MQKVKEIDEITMQFVLMDSVDFLEHIFDCVFLDGFVDLGLALGVGEGIQDFAELDHFADVVEDKLISLVGLEFLSQTLVQIDTSFIVPQDKEQVGDLSALNFFLVVGPVHLWSPFEKVQELILGSVELLVPLG